MRERRVKFASTGIRNKCGMADFTMKKICINTKGNQLLMIWIPQSHKKSRLSLTLPSYGRVPPLDYSNLSTIINFLITCIEED